MVARNQSLTFHESRNQTTLRLSFFPQPAPVSAVTCFTFATRSLFDLYSWFLWMHGRRHNLYSSALNEEFSDVVSRQKIHFCLTRWTRCAGSDIMWWTKCCDMFDKTQQLLPPAKKYTRIRYLTCSRKRNAFHRKTWPLLHMRLPRNFLKFKQHSTEIGSTLIWSVRSGLTSKANFVNATASLELSIHWSRDPMATLSKSSREKIT